MNLKVRTYLALALGGLGSLHMIGRIFNVRPLPAKKGDRLVLFDGVCGLCDHTVQTLLQEDRAEVLRFAPLQGETARAIRDRHNAELAGMDSIVLVENVGTPNEKIYVRSEAVLRVCDAIGGFWRVISWIRIVPAGARDVVYDWVARNRYAWFGRFDACKRPSAETKARFLP